MESPEISITVTLEKVKREPPIIHLSSWIKATQTHRMETDNNQISMALLIALVLN